MLNAEGPTVAVTARSAARAQRRRTLGPTAGRILEQQRRRAAGCRGANLQHALRRRRVDERRRQVDAHLCGRRSESHSCPTRQLMDRESGRLAVEPPDAGRAGAGRLAWQQLCAGAAAEPADAPRRGGVGRLDDDECVRVNAVQRGSSRLRDEEQTRGLTRTRRKQPALLDSEPAPIAARRSSDRRLQLG